jgi:hypothetical protein
MAFALLRLFETKTPLLPVVVAATVGVGSVCVAAKGNNRATASVMPASAEDYVWAYTESGEAALRPVIVAVGGCCDQNVKRRL